MNEIRVASIAFAAYLVSSAERTSITSKPLVVALERRVDGAHRGDRALVVGADHDAVGPHEVLDRRALLQELRIRHHGERRVDAARAKLVGDRRAHAIRGARPEPSTCRRRPWRSVIRRPMCARGREHVLHVGGPVLVRRRADGDELQRAVRDRRVADRW